MHVTVCLLRADRPTHVGDAAKSGQFIGQLLWVTGDPIGLKGLTINGVSNQKVASINPESFFARRNIAPVFPWIDNCLAD